MTRKYLLIGSLTLLILMAVTIMAQKKEPQKTMIDGHVMYTVLQPGDIPAVFDPEFINIKEAEDYYYPEEPLISVKDGETAKAYSTWHLDHHEVVNDYINGKAITVTW